MNFIRPWLILACIPLLVIAGCKSSVGTNSLSDICEARFDPNPSKRTFTENHSGDLEVIAYAGSGKTESISRRVAEILRRGNSPESIVALTVTEKPAVELLRQGCVVLGVRSYGDADSKIN